MASRWLRLLLVIAALAGGAAPSARMGYAEVAAAPVTVVVAAPRLRTSSAQRRARPDFIAPRATKRPLQPALHQRSHRYLLHRALLL
jgi:hypothetical protein